MNEDMRTIAVLNRKYGAGQLLNALGHIALGAGAGFADRLELERYEDGDGTIHPHISRHPFIVLRADNGNKIRRLRQELVARDIPFVDFVDTMFQGGSDVQKAATRATSEAELDYVGICFVAMGSAVSDLTRKFSLFTTLDSHATSVP
ncbi:DUF2000 domain-containing protein [Nocardia sp. CDC159]|uniref:DUF2000 domain-containing protein n=1 Tax=Nocardia pulmonis TaxID=2951408 RepID=A0A9X2E9J4_9NOCA|nr:MULTISPECIES: DUF2000 domain-containing protein [Nocardia]MCM6774316.1 DUF2000 domain-containing protein [Nocardia pulmonis]MCM6787618.1 DUF2000 domain-containing protein [Nocardia sp. CDC159]